MGSRVNRSGSFCQDPQDEFVVGKAGESLESFGEVVGSDQVAEGNAQLVMAVVVETLNCGFFDGAVHRVAMKIDAHHLCQRLEESPLRSWAS
jgi:hypothetical protein